MNDHFKFEEELFMQHKNEKVNSVIMPRLKKNIRMNGENTI